MPLYNSFRGTKFYGSVPDVNSCESFTNIRNGILATTALGTPVSLPAPEHISSPPAGGIYFKRLFALGSMYINIIILTLFFVALQLMAFSDLTCLPTLMLEC